MRSGLQPLIQPRNLAPVDEPLFRAVRQQRIDIDWKFGAGEGIRTPDPNLGNVPRQFTPQHLFLSQKPLSPYSIRILIALDTPCGILCIPGDFRSRASPLLPRPPPGNPGKQI